MITQIEIDGFKTFLDFKVELAPFQVLVGPNASGKSNLFDALHLLSRLAEVDIRSAFQDLRGSPDDQFTLFPDGRRSDHIRMAVELLVDRKVQDLWGKQGDLRYTRLRYELTIVQFTDTYGLDQLQVQHESLVSIPFEQDRWSRKYGLSRDNGWLPDPGTEYPSLTFIETKPSEQTGSNEIYLYLEEYPIEARGNITLQPETMQSTVLSGITGTTGFPHTFAVSEELRLLKFLHLNPEALRQPSSFKAPTFLSREGNNLAAMLNRMQTEDKLTMTAVSRDLAILVPGILKAKVKRDDARGEFEISIETSDENTFSTRVLSDGTLRLLALATLRNDPQFHGVLCLEEPEDGVHPLRLQKMARLLREIATDFSDPQQQDLPLNQLLITTHSPAFISQPEIRDVLLFTYNVMRVAPRKYALEITCMTPVGVSYTPQERVIDAEDTKAGEVYSLGQVIKYLESDTLDEARHRFEQNRLSL